MANNTRTINTIRSSTHYHTLSAPKHIDIAHFTPELGRKNETDANTVLAYVPFFFSAWHNHAGRMCCAAATIYSVINKSNESKYLWMRWITFVYNKLETCMGTCPKKNQATIWSANIRWLQSSLPPLACMFTRTCPCIAACAIQINLILCERPTLSLSTNLQNL